MPTTVQGNTNPEGSQWPTTSPWSPSHLVLKENMNAYDIVIIMCIYTHKAQGQNASTARKNNRKMGRFPCHKPTIVLPNSFT